MHAPALSAAATEQRGSPREIALKIVVFVAGAVLMGLEILGSRVLAPRFGSSVYVWGSLISTFLVALSAGYALGGRIADRRPSLAALSVVLSLAAVLMLPAIVWPDRILDTVEKAGWDVRWSALAAAVALFLPASLAMGMVTPFAVRIGLRRMEVAGRVSGGYAALSTAGSIAGTLATTFVLIPAFPVGTLLTGLAAALLACAALIARDRRSIAGAVVATLVLASALAARVPTGAIGNETVLLRRDTPYHHLQVTQIESLRWLRFDALTQSAIDLARPERSVVGYDEALLAVLAFRPEIRRVCVIGLGGGTFQRSFARLRPDAVIDTIEIDPAVRDVARDYFLYRESDRMRTVISDGRVYLSRPGPAYDLIVLDAFQSTGVPFHLTTREFFELVRRRLSPGGIFAANFVGQLMGGEGRLFWATYHTIQRQFGQIWVASSYVFEGRPPVAGNIIVYATVSTEAPALGAIQRAASELASRWDLRNTDDFMRSLVHAPQAPPGIPELTDAYAPVEALQNF